MPIELERALEKAARKHGYKGKQKDKYVYGTMNKIEGRKKKKKNKKYKMDTE